MFDLTPGEWNIVKKSPICQKYDKAKLSAMTIANIVTDINACEGMTNPKTTAILKFLFNLRELLVMDSSGNYKDSNSDGQYRMLVSDCEPRITDIDLSLAAAMSNARRKEFRVEITCDGGGAYANQSLVAALASYYGVFKVKLVKSDHNVAAGATLTFESPAGTPALPSVCALPALVANTFTNALNGLIISHASYTANAAIVVDLASFNAGDKVVITGEKWYEK